MPGAIGPQTRGERSEPPLMAVMNVLTDKANVPATPRGLAPGGL